MRFRFDPCKKGQSVRILMRIPGVPQILEFHIYSSSVPDPAKPEQKMELSTKDTTDYPLIVVFHPETVAAY
jgi:hypothetical protein